jgi:hypothetical protein
LLVIKGPGKYTQFGLDVLIFGENNKRGIPVKKLLISLLLVLMSFSANAQWQLSESGSTVKFISIKNSTVGEVHTFKGLSGAINKGIASVDIKLASVETNIPIRNDRMRTMLFEVANGDRVQSKVDLDVKLHGVTKVMSADIQVVKLNDSEILVSSISPLILRAEDFNLSNGVDALRDIAKLTSISTAVPVTFNLVFTK